MTASRLVDCLKSSELFSTLTTEEIKSLILSLASACKEHTYAAGEYVFTQGEDNFSKLFIVEEGQVLLQRSVNIGTRTAMWPLGLLSSGGAMGWSSLLFGPHRCTATATCQKATRLVSFEATMLKECLEKNPGTGFKVMERLAHMLGSRLRAAISTMEAHL